jgi:hypothetical protein
MTRHHKFQTNKPAYRKTGTTFRNQLVLLNFKKKINMIGSHDDFPIEHRRKTGRDNHSSNQAPRYFTYPIKVMVDLVAAAFALLDKMVLGDTRSAGGDSK